MMIPVLAIVEARERSLLLRLGLGARPLVRVPRSSVCNGDCYHGGERDLEMDFESWIYREIMTALERAKVAGPGRVLDVQMDMMRERT